jgi:Coenzyme PQQ synthesis protein D (PqqD)
MASKRAGSGTGETSSSFRPGPDVIAQRLGEEVVLVHMQTDRIFELNRTASRLWDLLASGCTRAEAQRRMLEEFTVDASQLSEEIDTILSSLVAEELLSAHESN